MQNFSYLDKREVMQQEYSQSPILPSPHFRWVVNCGKQSAHFTCVECTMYIGTWADYLVLVFVSEYETVLETRHITNIADSVRSCNAYKNDKSW